MEKYNTIEEYNEIALKEFKKYLELPRAFKEQYIPIYNPRALKFMYISNPVEVFKISNLVMGENKHFLNIEEISKKFLDNF